MTRQRNKATPALDSLTTDERGQLLQELLASHPGLVEEAERRSLASLATVDADEVAESIEWELREDDTGAIVERYDRLFCAGDAAEQLGDLANYSTGDHFSVWTIGGVRRGALICHDCRYPELYREYKRVGVQLVLHSFHAAHVSARRLEAMRAEVGFNLQGLNPGGTYPSITMPATMTAAAASSHVWISCPNSSARESCWPSSFVRADGVTTGRLRQNMALLTFPWVA